MDESIRLMSVGKTEKALERLKTLLTTVDEIDWWRVHELIGAAFHDIGDPDGAAQACFNAAQSDRYLRAQRQHFSNYLFALHYLPRVDNDALADEHRLYNSLYRDTKTLKHRKNRRDKIAVGYIAHDFLDGAPARFYESLLTLYNRAKFHVTCFSLSNDADNFTNAIKNAVNSYVTLDSRSIENSARIVADAALDILFDLSGHSDGGLTLQIMAHRPAPIQIAGIGWIDTTGLAAIDYILTDNFLTPAGSEKYFVERFLTVPHALTFTPKMIVRNRKPRRDVTFGCFNNFMKVTDDYLDCVAAILESVPNARFIMQDTTRISARRRRMLERVKNFLPIDRIEIRLGRDDYFDDYADVDVILDTFPYNGGAMTATALCMNVPVVSVTGGRYGSRFGADILRAAGLDELIADNRDDFIERAIEVAIDRRDVIECVINSPLLDTKKFVADIEMQYLSLKKLVDDGVCV